MKLVDRLENKLTRTANGKWQTANPNCVKCTKIETFTKLNSYLTIMRIIVCVRPILDFF